MSSIVDNNIFCMNYTLLNVKNDKIFKGNIILFYNSY